MASHSDDGDGNPDPRYVLVPAVENIKDKLRPVYPDIEVWKRQIGFSRGPSYHPERDEKEYKPIGFIPQVENTQSQTESNQAIMNEKGVGMNESTCSGRTVANACKYPEQREKEKNCAYMSVNEMTRVALERSSSAKEAVQIMGDLAVKYGFQGPDAGKEGSSESLMVADGNEGWSFHVTPSDANGTSAVWVAQRVPDDGFTVTSNMFTIREVDFSSKDFMYSPTMKEIALKNKWWKPGQPFDFTRIYSNGEYLHKYQSGRRMWRALSLANTKLKLDPTQTDILDKPAQPWSVTPDRKLSAHDFIAIHRDSQQGTPFDQKTGYAAGAFGSPNRQGPQTQPIKGHWERPIDIFRTTQVHVTVCNKVPELSHTWQGHGVAHASFFVPFFSGILALPDAYSRQGPDRLERRSAYWAVRTVATLMDLKYSYMQKDVQPMQNTIEGKGDGFVKFWSEQLTDKRDRFELTKHNMVFADEMTAQQWTLPDKLIYKYASGYLTEDPLPYPKPTKIGQDIDQPIWWLKTAGFQNGPPDVPPINRGEYGIDSENENKNLRNIF